MTTTTTNTVTLPTIEKIRDVILSRILGSPGLSGADTAKGGFFWRLAHAFASQGRNLLVRAASVWKDCNPSSAKGDALAKWADTCLGEGAAAATKWVGKIEIRCVNNTQTVPVGQTGSHEDGTTYITTAAILPVHWALIGPYYAGLADAESVTLGTVANKAATTSITLASPPVGVYDTAYLYSTTTEAEEAETEEELQARIAQHLADMPGGGSAAEFRAWCQEVDGIYDACIYPRWNGVGVLGDLSVRIVLLGPPGDRFLTLYPTAAADVATHLADRTPLFALPADVDLPAAVDTRVAVAVFVEDGYGPDYWDLGIYTPTVDSIVVGTRRINLSISPVGFLVPGNRVVVHCDDGHNYQMVVQTVGVGYIIVDTAWTSNPTLTKLLRAGGPLWQPMRDAVQAVFDSLGSSHSNTAAKPRWPLVEVELMSTLFPERLAKAMQDLPGVATTAMITPAVAVDDGVAENVAPQLFRLAGVGANPDFMVTWGLAE